MICFGRNARWFDAETKARIGADIVSGLWCPAADLSTSNQSWPSAVGFASSTVNVLLAVRNFAVYTTCCTVLLQMVRFWCSLDHEFSTWDLASSSNIHSVSLCTTVVLTGVLPPISDYPKPVCQPLVPRPVIKDVQTCSCFYINT